MTWLLERLAAARRAWVRLTVPTEWEAFRPDGPLVGIRGERVSGPYAFRCRVGDVVKYRNATPAEADDAFASEAW